MKKIHLYILYNIKQEINSLLFSFCFVKYSNVINIYILYIIYNNS